MSRSHNPSEELKRAREDSKEELQRVLIMQQLEEQLKNYQTKPEKKLEDAKKIISAFHQFILGAAIDNDYKMGKFIFESAISYNLKYELSQAFGITSDADNNTLLHLLVLLGDHELLRDSLDLLAELSDQRFIHFQNKAGETPLMIAIKNTRMYPENLRYVLNAILLLQKGANLSGIPEEELKETDRNADQYYKKLMKTKEKASLNWQEKDLLKNRILLYILWIEKLPYLSPAEKIKRGFELYQAAVRLKILPSAWIGFKKIIDLAVEFEQLKNDHPEDKNNAINYNTLMVAILKKLKDEEAQDAFFNSLDFDTLLNLSHLMSTIKEPFIYALPPNLSDKNHAAIRIAYAAYQQSHDPKEKDSAKQDIHHLLFLNTMHEIKSNSNSAIKKIENNLLKNPYENNFRLLIYLFAINYPKNINRANEWLRLMKLAPQLFISEAEALMKTPGLTKTVELLISNLKQVDDKRSPKNRPLLELDHNSPPTVRWAKIMTAISTYEKLKPMTSIIDNYLIEFKDNNFIKHLEGFQQAVIKLNFQLSNHHELISYKNELLILKKQIEQLCDSYQQPVHQGYGKKAGH